MRRVLFHSSGAWRAARAAAVAGLVLVTSSCAPKTVPVPVVSTPKYPDYVQPVVPDNLANTAAAANQERGWTFLQAGDTRNAEREFASALKQAPTFYPAEIGLGYVELARKNDRAALARFDGVLARQPAEASALVGRGEADLALDREEEALTAFQAAVAANPALADVQRRVAVLVFRRVQENLRAARTAARSGQRAQAVRAYMKAIAESPDSPLLYRELAAVERQDGNAAAALEHFRKAVALDPNDAASLAQIGELLEAQGDLQGAIKAFGDAVAIEDDPAVEAKLEEARGRAEAARLPSEYRAIDTAVQLTRADLAALVGVRLAPLVQAGTTRDAVLLTDVGSNWAASWIMSVTRAGLMEPFANHTFQPKAPVRRVDFAGVVARVLNRIAALEPSRAGAWNTARVRFIDLAPSHLAYPAASAAVSAGVMTAAGGTFDPNRVVTGPEAVAAIDRLQALADLPR